MATVAEARKGILRVGPILPIEVHTQLPSRDDALILDRRRPDVHHSFGVLPTADRAAAPRQSNCRKIPLKSDRRGGTPVRRSLIGSIIRVACATRGAVLTRGFGPGAGAGARSWEADR